MNKTEQGARPAAADALPAADETDETPPLTGQFSFTCGNRAYQAWTQHDADGPSVYISTAVGLLPYTAENRGGRRAALLLLSGAGTIAGARLILTDFHRISVLAKSRIREVDDTVDVLSGAAAAVVNSLALIELMEICLEPGATPEAG